MKRKTGASMKRKEGAQLMISHALANRKCQNGKDEREARTRVSPPYLPFSTYLLPSSRRRHLYWMAAAEELFLRSLTEGIDCSLRMSEGSG